MLEIFPYNLQTDTSLGQPMQTLELARVAGVCFLYVCVLFVFREVRDTAARNLSRVQTGKRRRWGGGGARERTFFCPLPHRFLV